MGSRNPWEFPLFVFPSFRCASRFLLIKSLWALTHSWCLPAQVSRCLPEAHQGEPRRRTWRWGRGAGSGSGCGAARAHGPWGIILLTETFPSCWPQALSSPNGSLIGPMMRLSGSTHFLTLRFPAAPSPCLGPAGPTAQRPRQSCQVRGSPGLLGGSSAPHCPSTGCRAMFWDTG